MRFRPKAPVAYPYEPVYVLIEGEWRLATVQGVIGRVDCYKQVRYEYDLSGNLGPKSWPGMRNRMVVKDEGLIVKSTKMDRE